VIITGTLTGAGARLEPPIWLKSGDVVEVEADGIGVLRNMIADEDRTILAADQIQSGAEQ
jgi:2-keto-4-pentenoate hydratase/2-oxohepta-3-ene-1,7-dioic acid hydratase in catechol pathway